MATITLKINERSKAGIALIKLLELLENQPGIEILDNNNSSRITNKATLNSINDAISGKSESISLDNFRKQLYKGV